MTLDNTFHTPDTKKDKQVVDQEGPVWPIQGKDACELHWADGPPLLRRRQAHLHQDGQEVAVCQLNTAYIVETLPTVLKNMKPASLSWRSSREQIGCFLGRRGGSCDLSAKISSLPPAFGDGTRAATIAFGSAATMWKIPRKYIFS